MKNIYAASLLSLFFLSACGNPLGGKNASTVDSDFHPGAPTDTNTTPPAIPQPAVGQDSGIKLAPGTLRATGTSTAAKMAITNNDELLQGTHVSGRFSFSKSSMR